MLDLNNLLFSVNAYLLHTSEESRHLIPVINHLVVFCCLRVIKVQQEIAQRKKAYHKSKVQHIRKDDCRRWWNAVDKMTGRSEKSSSLSLERDGKVLDEME